MRALWVIALLAGALLAGCISDVDEPDLVVADPEPVPLGPTAAHVTAAENADPALVERLANATGTYYSTGMSTFEPTIGATQSGAIFMNSYRGLGSGQIILRSTDQGQTWSDVNPYLPHGYRLVPNSNDPFFYVDPFTSRVYDFDMCVTLQGFCIAYSDDDGESWVHQGIAHGFAPALDHQSMAAAPDRSGYPMLVYPNILVFCVNRGVGAIGPWCSSSFTGGFDWTPMVPGYPVGTMQCSGLHGHIKGSPDGRFYRGNPSCEGPAVYASADGGLSWTEHTVSTSLGMGPGLNGHEVAAATDDDGNVYAFWIAADGLPYLSVSTDHGGTWSTPLMVGAPGVTAAGFPAVEAGAAGRVSWAYIGTEVESGYRGEVTDMNWTGYVGFSLDFLGNQTFANVPVNVPDDPLDDQARACGRIRCGGFGDFISITIDPAGRPWAAMAHNEHGNAGIVGTLATGPSLRHDGDLAPLPFGGAAIWE